MRVSERTKSTPVGLSDFLVTHREHGGFETLRDSSLVTIVCSGCEASFSYLKPPYEDAPADVDEALARITSGGNGARNGGGSPAPKAPARRAEPEPPDSPRDNGRSVPPVPTRRLAPPGPHAPRRRGSLSLAERALVPLREHAREAIAWAGPRGRTFALTALAIAGAYLFISLSVGDDASSSSRPGATPPGAAAEPTSPPPAGFAVTMPPDWSRELTQDGSTAFVPDDLGGEVLVRAQPRGTLTYGQMTDEAAAYIAGRVEPGTLVARPAWKWVGNLLSVAVASEPDGHSEIAYIGVTPEARYLVVRSIEPHASALVRLQADAIVTSFAAQ